MRKKKLGQRGGEKKKRGLVCWWLEVLVVLGGWGDRAEKEEEGERGVCTWACVCVVLVGGVECEGRGREKKKNEDMRGHVGGNKQGDGYV